MPKVIGTAPYQVPTNADLGTMAFQDASAISIDLLQVDNIRIDGNSITATNSNGSLTIDPNGTGSITLDSDVTISGNLTINGTTTTTNSTTITVDDPVFTLGGDTAPTSDDNKDRGIEFRWHNGSAAKVGFFGYDDSAARFVFIPDATNTSEVFSGVLGDVNFGAATFTKGLIINEDGGDSDTRIEGDADINLVFVDASADKVGIGTSSPTSKLTVNGTFDVTGNTILGDASTDTVLVNGYMGIGSVNNANIFRITGSGSFGGPTQVGISSNPTGTSSGTTALIAIAGSASSAAAAYTVIDVFAFSASDATKGAGSTITNQHGLYIADQTQGTNNYGITSAVSSAANKWNIYASGTAANYFAGNVGIGGTTITSLGTNITTLQLNGGATGRTGGIRLASSDGSQGAAFYVADTLGYIGTTTNHSLLIQQNSVERLRLTASEAVFNELGNDYDFRVESDTNTHAIFLDAQYSRVGINNSSPGYELDVGGGIRASALSDIYGYRIVRGHSWTSWTANAYYYLCTVNPYSNGVSAAFDLTLSLTGRNGSVKAQVVAKNAGGTTDASVIVYETSLEGVTLVGYRDAAVPNVIHFYGKSSTTVSYTPQASITGTQSVIIDSTAPASPPSETFTWSGDAVNIINLTVDRSAVFNESGGDYDFRVESDTNTHALFVDAANSQVIINGSTAGPATTSLLVNSGANGRSVFRHDSGDGGVTISGSANSSAANLVFGNDWGVNGSTFTEEYRIFLDGADDSLNFKYDGNTKTAVTFTAAGSVGIGTSSPSYLLSVNSSTAIGSSAALLSLGTTASASSGNHAAIGISADSTSAGSLLFYTKFGGGLAERLRIDSSGNVGLGVTPSSWSTAWTSLNIAGNLSLAGRSANTEELYLTANAYNDGVWKYIASNNASQYYQDAGTHVWRTAPSGTAGNAITFTERANMGLTEMVINEPGNDYDFRVESDTNTHALFVQGSGDGFVGIGASAPVTTEKAQIRVTADGTVPNTLRLVNSGTSVGSGNRVLFGAYTNSTSYTNAGYIDAVSSDATSGYISFGTSTSGSLTEKLRIKASGNTYITGNYAFGSIGAAAATFTSNDDDGNTSISGNFGSQKYQMNVGSNSHVFYTSSPQAQGTEIAYAERVRFTNTEAIFNDPGNDYDFRVESDANTHALFVQGSDGNVGIGTSAPQSKLNIVSGSGVLLQVQETTGTTGTTAALRLKNTSSTGEVVYWDIQSERAFVSGGTGGQNLKFIHSTSAGTITERMRITPAGDVGIGTDDPGEKLDVRGNLRVGGADAGPNYIAFRGTTGDGPGSYNHTYIGERIHTASEASELVIFKGNDPSVSGPDRIRLIGSDIVLDTYASAVSGTFEAVSTSANVTTKAILKSDGKFGIGTITPTVTLDVESTSGDVVQISSALTTTGAIDTGPAILLTGHDGGAARNFANIKAGKENGTSSNYASYLAFSTRENGQNLLEAARITSDRRFLLNSTSSIGVGSGATALQQIASTSASVHLSLTNYANATDGGILAFGKSRGTTVGSYTLVANGDTLGEIRFAGSNGSNLQNVGAIIKAVVSAAPGATDLPTSIVFQTSPDGAASVADRLTISHTGTITSTGDLVVGSASRAADSYIRVLSGDSNKAGLEAYGSAQGTGYTYVGQSTTFGGGMFYNGDGSPSFASNEISDTVGFYRNNNGSNVSVFSYPYDSNVVTFTNGIVVNELGENSDTRIEGDADVNLFFADASADSVGIGTNAPASKLHVYQGGLSTGTVDLLKLEGNLSDIGLDPIAVAIAFKIQDGNNPVNEARIRMASVNDTDYGDNDEAAANLIFSTTDAGVETDKLIITGNGRVGILTTNPNATLDVRGSVIINEDGGDNDVRIEGDTDVNLFFTDASADKVGIGTDTPTAKLHISGGDLLLDRGSATQGLARKITIGGARNGVGNDYATVQFQNYDSNSGAAEYIGAEIGAEINSTGVDGGELVFRTSTTTAAPTDRLRILADGGIVINEVSADVDVRIEGNGDENLFFTDGGTDRIGIGISTPQNKLHIQQSAATTNAVVDVLRLDYQSTGTPLNGIGVGLEFAVETAAGNTEVGAAIEAVTTDVTATSEDFNLVFRTMIAGAAAAQVGRLNGSSFQVGANSTNTTITTQGTSDLILNTNAGTNSGVITIFDGANANIELAPNGTGDVYLTADTVRVGDSNADATITTNGTGDLILNTNGGSNSGSITIFDAANGNIVLAPNGTGDVQLDADTVRVGDSGANATITTNGAGDLILNTNGGTNSGSITIFDAANGNIELAPHGTGDVYLTADTVRVGDSNADATITTNGTGDLILNTNAGSNSGKITIFDAANGNIELQVNGTGTVVVNEAAATADFRVEGNADANLLFADGSANSVGIGTSSPNAKLDIVATTPSTDVALRVKSNVMMSSPDATKNMNIRMLDTDVLTFSGSAGQLFSVSNSLTGTIFAVNDVSGMPSIEVFDTGNIQLAELTGNVLIGTSVDSGYKLRVNGVAHINEFPSAVADRPIFPGGIVGLETGDGNFDIWGISKQYYPSNTTTADAWGIRWDGDSNQVRFIGAGTTRLAIDLDGGTTGLTWQGSTVWHAGNDGAGSTLDADLLDGQHGSYYLDWTNVTNKPDPVITLTGDVTGSGTMTDVGNVSITTTVVDDSHNHTSLTGVTSIGFAANATDTASISTTIDSASTYFDFNLSDDNNADWWRWRFTPSGSSVYDAMTLKPSANGVADLAIPGAFSLQGSITYNDVSRYWLVTATNWGVYWDTADNRIEFHGSGTDRWGVDLDNGNSVQVGTITADSAEFTGLGTSGDPGTDDLYVGGYGIQGNRASPIYVHNHGAGGVRISTNAALGTANGILVEENQTTVTGLLTATTKSFTIPHPTKPGKKLRYGSLEGPEHGVYVRGKLKGDSVIELPEYWTKLVDPDSITVQLTPIGKHQKLYVEEIIDNKVYVKNDSMFGGEVHCFYYVQAERVDVDKIEVECD